MKYIVNVFVQDKNGIDLPDYNNHEVDIVDSLAEALDSINRDTWNYEKTRNVHKLQYLIYVVTNEQLEDEEMQEELYNSTDYVIDYVKSSSNFTVNELNVEGLEFNGERIEEFESYKILGFNSFSSFVDDIVYDIEYKQGYSELEIPTYEELKEPSLTYLKNGQIQKAKERLEYEILKFNDLE